MKTNILTAIATLACAASLMGQAPVRPAPAKAAASAASQPSLLSPDALKEKAPEVFRAKFTTTRGDFVVEVKRAWAPNGADRFYNLVKNGFYDGAGIFRVLPGFVAQFGIPGEPAVARVWAKATIPDDPVKESNLRGYLTFATAGPNSRTTQLFINLADNPTLNNMGFAPFARVVEGMDVVDKFYSGYGEGAPRGSGPDQGRITNEGKTYLDKSFPKLDSIKSAVVQSAGPPSSRKVEKEKK